MTPLSAATTGDPTAGWLLLAVGAVLWLAGYAVACWCWPFAHCGACKGKGRKKSPTGRAFRNCRRCRGSGRRLRTGRRVFNLLSHTYREASKDDLPKGKS